MKDAKKMIGAAPPLNILYIAAVLEDEGIEVSLLDQSALGLSINSAVEWVKKENLAILGFSTLNVSGRTAALVAEAAKRGSEGHLRTLRRCRQRLDFDRLFPPRRRVNRLHNSPLLK